MRVAVFSDVHGNLTALTAVLDDIARQNVDEVVFAGDLCLVGPRPAACVEALQTLDCRAVYGNTDDWLLGRQEPPPRLRELARWTHAQLNAAQRGWLESLPFSHLVTPTADNSSSLLVVHANPQDVNQLIFPPEEEQAERYGHVRQSDEVLDDMLRGTQQEIIAFGHLHLPFLRVNGPYYLYNISSVSMPGDGDARAKYGLFDWQDGRWSFERRYVPYESVAELTAYRAIQPPGWQGFAEAVAAQGVVPQQV